MRFLYIAPRYHTNQVPIVHGLISEGHEVKFITQYVGPVENYTDINPVVVGYSKVFNCLFNIINKLSILNDARLTIFKMKCGFPSKSMLQKEIAEFSPDVVITRERSTYSMVATSICKKLKKTIILYDQSPYYLDMIKKDLPHRIVKSLTPNKRMTPVLGTQADDKVVEPKSAYIPFVMEPNTRVNTNKEDGIGKDSINILEIGKYENRKNHIMMLDVFEKLSRLYDINLTIIGECTTESHKEYYNKLSEKYNDMSSRNRWTADKVKLLSNLSHENMKDEYLKADLFVLPSTAEPASISQLEAMSYALPVICSDKNGTSCYVEDGINGYRFKDMNEDSLYEKMNLILSNSKLLNDMGNNSIELVKTKYGIDQYIKKVMELAEL